MERKLVSVQRVQEVNPIPNADLLESVLIQGWNVVVGKDAYKAGDLVAYFEIDSFLPDGDPRYEDFQKRGQRTTIRDGLDIKGHVLRTIKLRGTLSQGLVMSLEELGLRSDLPVGTDITQMVGVFKYEEPVPVTGDLIGPFDTKYMPKTDSIRAQNLSQYWEEIVNIGGWTPTLKIDGTSQTILRDDDGSIRIFGRNWELNPDNSTGLKIAKSFGIVDELEPTMAVQFELAGPSINGNRLRLDSPDIFVFSVWKEGHKVDPQNWSSSISKKSAPIMGDEWKPQGTLSEMIDKVTTLSGNVTKNIPDEGIVYHRYGKNTSMPLWMDRNNNFKIINNKYLTKYGL